MLKSQFLSQVIFMSEYLTLNICKKKFPQLSIITKHQKTFMKMQGMKDIPGNITKNIHIKKWD